MLSHVHSGLALTALIEKETAAQIWSIMMRELSIVAFISAILPIYAIYFYAKGKRLARLMAFMRQYDILPAAKTKNPSAVRLALGLCREASALFTLAALKDYVANQRIKPK